MLLIAAAAVAGTVFAARLTRRGEARRGEDRVVASLVVGFGVFASPSAVPWMVTTAAR